jgi:hypothetical protein
VEVDDMPIRFGIGGLPVGSLAALAAAVINLIHSIKIETAVDRDAGADGLHGGQGARAARVIIQINWPAMGGMGRTAPSR